MTKIHLKELTCEKLADILDAEPSATEEECSQLRELRKRYYNKKLRDILRMCKGLSAAHHAAHYKSALLAKAAIENPLKLVIGGGKPKISNLPRFTKSMLKIAKDNGVIIHRWKKGAFTLAKP